MQTRAFTATLASNTVISGGVNSSNTPLTGMADFVLTWDPMNLAMTSLSYDIHVDADLDGSQTADLSDDVTAIHLHDITMCMMASCQMGDTAQTMHVLNLFGAPRHDDAAMQYFPADGRVTGVWDMADEDMMLPMPSMAPGPYVDELFDGKLYLMVHTRQFPTGAFGGYLLPVPEPHSVTGMLLGMAVLGWRRRRSG